MYVDFGGIFGGVNPYVKPIMILLLTCWDHGNTILNFEIIKV